MKRDKFICLILSFILVLSIGPVQVSASENITDDFSRIENDQDIKEQESFPKYFENEEINTGNSTDEGTDITGPDDNNSQIISEESADDEDSGETGNQDEYLDDITTLIETDEESADTQWSEIQVSLTYDDRYSLGELSEIAETNKNYVISDIENDPTSYQVISGVKTNTKDDEVITPATEDSLDIIATGVGTATVYLLPEAGDNDETADSAEDNLNGFKVTVTVEPARLTMMYLVGQSNMEGMCSDIYDLDASVACQEGTVYSTYVPVNDTSGSIAGIKFSSDYKYKEYKEGYGAAFVADSLQSNRSMSGSELEYPLNSLTTAGKGKTGPDSSLAYEWNRLTEGDKVWVVNTAYSATVISTWVPGGNCYDRSLDVWNYVKQVYQAEIDAGHYTKGDQLAFWLQGETGDRNESAEYYLSNFNTMYSAMKKELGLDSLGIIMVRASTGSYINEDELKMTGPRIAQYVLGSSSGLSGVYVVSNVNEQWVSDSGVQSYFKAAYPNGSLNYPMQGSGKTSLPTKVTEVHSNIHYSQIGHNENGITAANGMYQALYKSTSPSDVYWKDEDGKTVSSMNISYTGDTYILVPVTEPVYAAKKISISISGNTISYDRSTCAVTAIRTGTTVITASYSGKTISQISVKVDHSSDLTAIAGDYTGIYYYDGTWWYLKNGIIQSNYEGVEKNENGWWYINDGRVDFSYTGFAENSYGWWYIENGKVTFNKNSVIQDTNKKIDGEASWWYVVGSKVQKDFTGLADYQNNYGWWYIEKGKVSFTANTVAKNKNGWYYVEDSKVIFSYTGFAQNSYGWWYIENGKVTFNKNSVIKDTYKKINGSADWWYVDGSKVQSGYTGVANYKNSNGWWYVKNGKVDFSANTVAKNKNGWWYVLSGKVQFGYTGLADYKNEYGWWYIQGGKVDFNHNGVDKNINGWWYVKNGKVDFSFNGIASNKNGSWYLEGGKVRFSYNGTYTYKGKKYTIVNGKVK